MYLELWMQMAIVLTFGCCAAISYRIGESRGKLLGGLQTLDFLKQENIISIDSSGIIRPHVIERPKKRSAKNKDK